jgi:hypothetical protein
MDKILSNRQKALEPRLGLHYCVCDFNRIGRGGKCSVCGRKAKKRRLKK